MLGNNTVLRGNCKLTLRALSTIVIIMAVHIHALHRSHAVEAFVSQLNQHAASVCPMSPSSAPRLLVVMNAVVEAAAVQVEAAV